MATGTQPVIADRVMGWMEIEEGMQAVAPIPGGLRWARDTHWTTATRLAMGSDATKSLRGMPQVIHRQTSLGANEQLVELEVDTGRIRKTAWGVGAGVTALGVASGVVAAVLGGGSNALDFASVAVPGAVVAASTVVVTARAWTASIRKGMTTALNGIAHPELYRRSSRRRQRRAGRNEDQPRSGFSRLADDVADVLDDLFD